MFILLFAVLSAWGLELPRQYITDTPWSDEFSERTSHAPFYKLTPQPLQLTSPYFENLFLNSTAVQSRSQGSPGTSIRGSSQAARVLFLLDNIPLNFLDGLGGSSLFVPTEILQHINVFEGPTSALYGSNAMGGAIHFVPQKRKNSLLRLGLSDTDNSAMQGKGVSIANAALIFPLFKDDNNSLQMSVFTENDRGDFPFIDSLGQKGQRQNNDQQLRRFTLLGSHTTTQWKISHLWLYADLRKTTPGSLPSPILTDQSSKAFLGGVSSELKTSSTSVWTSRLSYASLHSDFVDTAISRAKSDKVWLSQIFAWEFFPGFLSQTLFDVNQNFYTASFIQDQQFDRSEPELAQSFIFPIHSQILIEPTVRHLFRYNQTLFQLQIPWQFESAKVWLMYSEGFRPPSLTDLYAQTAYFQGNNRLLPEKSQQYELGQSWTSQIFTFSSSLFLLQYKDLLQNSVLPSSQFTKINIGEAQSYGLNAKLDIQQHNWHFHVSHSYLIARETASNSPLLFSPKHQFFSSFSYALNEKSLLLLQQSFWSSIVDLDFVNNRNVSLTPWASTDLLFQWKMNTQFSVQAGVYNLFNKRREMTFGYPEPQRRVALALESVF
jgi:vitamin B12 transporter